MKLNRNGEYLLNDNTIISFSLSDLDAPYITSVEGRISLYGDDDQEVPIGKLEAQIFRKGEMINHGYRPPKGISAWISQCGSVAAEEVFSFVTAGKDGDPPAQVIKAIGEEALFSEAIHFVESIEIDPEYRGHGYRLKLFYDYIKIVAGISPSSLIICHPSPFTSTSRQNRLQGARKLRQYWAQLGLVKIPDSEYYAMLAYQLRESEE